MTDDSMTDEQWMAEMVKKTREFGGPPVSDAELQAMQLRLHGNSPGSQKYPDSNASELAIYTSEGGIEITTVRRFDDGTYGHGTRLYLPGDKNFEYFWKRHDFNNRATKTHVIMQKCCYESDEQIDLGGEWI